MLHLFNYTVWRYVKNVSSSDDLDKLSTVFKTHNPQTWDHSRRVEKYCRIIGEKLELSKKETDTFLLFARFHDIGKMGVRKKIIQKPGKLTKKEWLKMKRHTVIGYEIAKSIPEIRCTAKYILLHHERWDGTGYPLGLEGQEIPYYCRVLAVADAFDAMTAGRAYRKAMTRKQALDELVSNSGRQFDPSAVRLFIETITP